MKRFTFSLLLLLGITGMAQAQHKAPQTTTVFIPQSVEPQIDYQYHDGIAFLRDGSYLKGRFQYNSGSAFIYRPTGQAPRQRIGLSTIRRLSLADADTLVTDRKDSTIFVRLGNRLYRQLAGGMTMVLDRRYLVTEMRGKIGRKMYVLDDAGDLHPFTSLQKLNKWLYTYSEQSGKQLPDVYRNQNEIVKAVVRINSE